MLHLLSKNSIYILVLVFAVLIAGCAPDPYQNISTSLVVTYQEDGFTPRHWKVPSGQEIELTLNNLTAIPRFWILMARPAEIPLQDSDRRLVCFESKAPANTTRMVTFSAPNAPGEYDIILDPNAGPEEGWVGKLIVYQTTFLKEIGKYPAPD